MSHKDIVSREIPGLCPSKDHLDQGPTSFCWMVSTIMLLLNLRFPLKPKVKTWLEGVIIKMYTGKLRDSCPVWPPWLKLPSYATTPHDLTLQSFLILLLKASDYQVHAHKTLFTPEQQNLIMSARMTALSRSRLTDNIVPLNQQRIKNKAKVITKEMRQKIAEEFRNYIEWEKKQKREKIPVFIMLWEMGVNGLPVSMIEWYISLVQLLPYPPLGGILGLSAHNISTDKPPDPRDEIGHAVAFFYCDGDYFYCNSWGDPCRPLRELNEMLVERGVDFYVHEIIFLFSKPIMEQHMLTQVSYPSAPQYHKRQLLPTQSAWQPTVAKRDELEKKIKALEDADASHLGSRVVGGRKIRKKYQRKRTRRKRRKKRRRRRRRRRKSKRTKRVTSSSEESERVKKWVV